MDWFTVGIVSQFSSTIGWTRTSASPYSGNCALSHFDRDYYGGYVLSSGEIPAVDVTATDDGGVITAPERYGHDFDGWFSFSGMRDFGGDGYTLDEATVKLSSSRVISYPVIFSRAGTIRVQPVGGVSPYYYHMIYAKWRPRSVAVILDVNGGQLPADTNYFIRATYSAPYGTLPTPTRSGYAFAGWFTAASGGSQVNAATTMTNPDDHTIYAHWTADAANVTLYFYAMGGTCATDSKPVTEGSAYGDLPVPTRPGYTFAGWYTGAYDGTQVSAATIAGDEDAVVYAHWTPSVLTITFDANGGTVTELSRAVPYGRQYQRLPEPSWAGHSFVGWFTAATDGTQVSKTDVPTTSHTLYAHWSAPVVIGWITVEIS